ncbi:hypothetical protein AB0D13_00415 [Streptomyces sp. NPDC048430]|uniref:hypothetical protein n=1 Tax=unclassified Streptomyces TaxID=2593676 RepID=UPI0034307E1D
MSTVASTESANSATECPAPADFPTAGSGEPTLVNLAGHAFPGGVFFLVSALRLNPTRDRA